MNKQQITLEQVRDEWRACYQPERLAALYPVPRTPLEVLTLREGPWAEVPDCDRIWTLTRSGALPDRVQRIFACDCAERALLAERNRGREPKPESLEAVRVSRLYADGTATAGELEAAMRAAYAAAAHTASYAAAYAAYAGVVYADAAAAYADAAAERAWQVSHLASLIEGGARSATDASGALERAEKETP